MATNKYSGVCKNCGGHVPAGKGILSHEWSNQDDDIVWVVRHADQSVCAAITAQIEQDAAEQRAALFIVHTVKDLGIKSDTVQDGEQMVIDLRTGYNSVGWLLTRTDNTLYLTSRNNLDGYDMSVTYTFTTPEWHINNLLDNLTVHGVSLPYSRNF